MTQQYNVASFFSGCGGFDLGFKEAGYNIVLANDIWPIAAASYRKNFPETEFILKNIKNLTKHEISDALSKRGLTKIDVVIGGPPCQCFTRLNNNNLKRDDQRNQLFKQYIRVVKLLNPDFVVMENVADLLVRKNVKGQYFKDLIQQSFKRAGYKVTYKVFEAEKYGVPQRRKRVIFVATNKEGMEITWPQEDRHISTVGPFLRKLKEFKSLSNNQVTINEKATLTRIKHIPPGGYYENLPAHLRVKKVVIGKLDLSDEELRGHNDECWEMLSHWLEGFLSQASQMSLPFSEAFEKLKPLAEEEFYLKDYDIKGFIDAVENIDGEVRIIDYKTTSKFEITKEYRLQLAIYAFLYMKKYGKKPDKVGIYFLKERLHLISVDEPMLQYAEQECKGVFEKTTSKNMQDYPQNVGYLCRAMKGNCPCHQYEEECD
jgi:DNA-cytosine methyltransferase